MKINSCLDVAVFLALDTAQNRDDWSGNCPFGTISTVCVSTGP